MLNVAMKIEMCLTCLYLFLCFMFYDIFLSISLLYFPLISRSLEAFIKNEIYLDSIQMQYKDACF